MGEMTDGMTGQHIRLSCAEYKDGCDQVRRLMEAGEGKLLQKLKMVQSGLEETRDTIPGRGNFIEHSVNYLLKKCEKRGVQRAHFREEWEYFLCFLVLRNCNESSDLGCGEPTPGHMYQQSANGVKQAQPMTLP